MAAYADYEFYVTTYQGAAIAQADFPLLALRASEVVDQVTFDRAAAVVTADTDAATVECVTKAFNEESVPPFGGWSGRGVRTTHSVVVARTGACISGREAPRATAR